MSAITLNLPPTMELTYEEFALICSTNPDLKLERTAWIKKKRWESLTKEQQQQFIPLCPDFVIQLPSNSDSLSELQKKMQEYLANGLLLGWLIDPQNKQVEVYQQNCPVEVIHNPVSLSGDNVLLSFTLNLKYI